MSSDKIQIGIPCGKNCEYYAEFLMNTIDSTVSEKHPIEYILGISNNNVDIEKLKKIETKYTKNIFKVKKVYDDFGATSQRHAECIGEILEKMDSRYGLIIDCDMAFLMKDWDLKFIEKLKDKVIVLGAPYHKTAKKYQNFPTVMSFFFDVKEMKKLEIDFSGSGDDAAEVASERESFLVQQPVGMTIVHDVGFQMPIKVRGAGLDGYALEHLKDPTRDAGSKFFLPGMRGDEYQIDGCPVMTHVGRSSLRDFKTEPVVVQWRSRVTEWLHNELEQIR